MGNFPLKKKVPSQTQAQGQARHKIQNVFLIHNSIKPQSEVNVLLVSQRTGRKRKEGSECDETLEEQRMRSKHNITAWTTCKPQQRMQIEHNTTTQ